MSLRRVFLLRAVSHAAVTNLLIASPFLATPSFPRNHTHYRCLSTNKLNGQIQLPNSKDLEHLLGPWEQHEDHTLLRDAQGRSVTEAQEPSNLTDAGDAESCELEAESLSDRFRTDCEIGTFDTEDVDPIPVDHSTEESNDNLEESRYRARHLRPRNILTEALRATEQSFPISAPATTAELIQKKVSHSSGQTLRNILVQHIQYFYRDPEFSWKEEELVDIALNRVYDEAVKTYLENRGISVSDIHSWAWILCSSTADRAAWRLAELSKITTVQPPLSLLMYILRAELLSASSVQVLVDLAWTYYRQQVDRIPDAISSTADYRQARHSARVDDPSSMILIARLLRHARRVVPETIEDIAELACYAFRGAISSSAENHARISPVSARRLSIFFNRTLSLLAIPTSFRPFIHIPILQQAQFRVLKRMTDFSPHIPITREGFRGIVRIQVAHKKTPAEREWAEYKAITWPPWKKDKLGLDVGRLFEGSTSRGKHVLNQMLDAGYELRDWEQIAQILSGWDLDDSPTIQTRRFLPHPRMNREIQGQTTRSRILATRTRREAWACFLEYESSAKKPCYVEVPAYEAMFERLLAPESKEGSAVLPGDSLERHPEPPSPHDWHYLSEELPTVNALLTRMDNAGVSPNENIIRMIIENETNFASVINLLSSRLGMDRFISLLVRAEQYDPDVLRAGLSNLKSVRGGRILVSYFRFLSRLRVSAKTFLDLRHSINIKDSASDIWKHSPHLLKSEDPICCPPKALIPSLYARYIILQADISLEGAWRSVFEAALPTIKSRTHDGRKSLNIEGWVEIRKLVASMNEANVRMSFEIFERICDELCDVLPSNSAPSEHFSITREQQPHRAFNLESVKMTQDLFAGIVWGRKTWNSRFLSASPIVIPGPFTLLAFTRCLGLAGDRQALLSLVKFMSRSSPRITEIAHETLRGSVQLRQVLVTMRIYLELLWTDESFLQGAPPSIPMGDYAMQAREIINKVQIWDGWPTDDEVRQACRVSSRGNDWISRLRKKHAEDQLLIRKSFEDKHALSNSDSHHQTRDDSDSSESRPKGSVP